MGDKVRVFRVQPKFWGKALAAREKAESASIYVPQDDGEFCRFLMLKGLAALEDEAGGR